MIDVDGLIAKVMAKYDSEELYEILDNACLYNEKDEIIDININAIRAYGIEHYLFDDDWLYDWNERNIRIEDYPKYKNNIDNKLIQKGNLDELSFFVNSANKKIIQEGLKYSIQLYKHPSKIPDWPKLEFVSWLKEIDGKAEATAINYACQLGKLLCDYTVSKNLCGFTLSTVKEISAMHDRDKNATLRNAIKAYVRFLEYKGKSSIPLVFSPEDENLFSLLFSFVKKTKVIFYFKNKTKNERLWTDSWYKEFYDLRKYIYNSSFFTEIDYSDVEKIKFELDMNDSIIVQYMNFLELKRNAEQGNDVAQFKLGLMYENGKGIEQNYKKAIEWYKKAAEQGYVDAQFHLGNMYCIGLGVVQDLEKAFEWYKKAAEHGIVYAQYSLGAMYERGKGVEQNYEKAFEWYKKAAEQSYVDAQYNLGIMYEHGQGVKQNLEKAIECFKIAAENGNQSAIEWYKKAAEQGNVYAQYDLGTMYERGKGVERDSTKASEWYEKAAEQGNEDAIKALEVIKVALLKTLEKRAEQGNKDAQYKLGTMYYNGEGVEQNYKESFCLYKKAAEQGSVNAQFMLGKMYYHGQGVERDYEKSIEWIGKTSKFGYEKAIDFFWRIKKKVEQSDIDAICYLGYMHYFGKGIKQDFANAINCFKKAAKQGNAEAIRALERFKKEDPFDSEDKIKLDNSVFTIDKTEEITTSRDAINWKKQKQEEKELYDEKIQSDVSLNTSDNADRTFFIKNVEIVSGNLINNNWQRKMQIIYTDKSDFIDNIPQFGGHDWSQDIGKSVEAIINESAGYYWLKFYKYKEELLRSNSYYESGVDWKEKRQEEKEKNFSAFLEQRKQMIIEKTSRQATPNFYNKHENSNMKNNNSFLEKYTPNVINSNLNKKIEESIQKSKILSSFVVIRSPLLQDGLLQFIKTDGSLLFVNEKCMRNPCLPWTNKKIEFNIYKTEEGKITDWDWNYYEPTSVKQI